MPSFLSNFEQTVSNFLQANQGLPLPVLIFLSFLGGLAASLTPCVLPMIPLYLSYIGASDVSSRIDAFKKTTMFCLGSALIFSLMGLFASFASFVMIEFRGYVHILIGIFILLMALFIVDLIKFPLPQLVKNIPQGGPFVVGLAFALVSSPCASPILFSVLALSSSVGGFIGGSMIMIAYSIGYTGLIFLTGLFASLAKQLDFFKRHSKFVSVICSIILAILGVFYFYLGIKWFFG